MLVSFDQALVAAKLNAISAPMFPRTLGINTLVVMAPLSAHSLSDSSSGQSIEVSGARSPGADAGVSSQRSVVGICILVLICAVFLYETTVLRRSQSLTFDETFYLNCGLQTISDGKLDPRICNEGVAPLPLMFTYLPPLAMTGGEVRPDKWAGSLNAPELIGWPRFLNSVLFSVPLIVLTYFWLQARRGWVAGVAGAGLLALSPLLVAHSSLATMDVGFAFCGIASLLTLAWALRAPSYFRFTGAAVMAAVALSAKYSAIFLFPCTAFLLLLTGESGGLPCVQTWAGWKQAFRWYMFWLAVVLPVWWGLHLFSFTGPLKNFSMAETPDDSPWVELLGRGPWATWFMEQAHENLKRPAPVAGVLFQILHNRAGHPSFLLGEQSLYGWWYYFPCVFAFKSTPAELALTIALFLALLASCRHPVRHWFKLETTCQTLLICSAVFVAMLLTAKINLGQRYLIILYPILILAGIDLLAARCRKNQKIFAMIVGMLLGAQLLSNVLSHPRELAYFNRFSGGSKNGVNLLSDSNIDWGQDLPALRQVIESEGWKRMAIDFYGHALPEAYGIHADLIDQLTDQPDHYDVFALSISNYQMGSAPDECYAPQWFGQPDRIAGASIYIYSLNTPERKQQFRELLAFRARHNQ